MKITQLVNFELEFTFFARFMWSAIEIIGHNYLLFCISVYFVNEGDFVRYRQTDMAEKLSDPRKELSEGKPINFSIISRKKIK